MDHSRCPPGQRLGLPQARRRQDAGIALGLPGAAAGRSGGRPRAPRTCRRSDGCSCRCSRARQGTGRSLAPANRDSYQTGLLMLICTTLSSTRAALDGPPRLQLDRHGDGRLPRSRRVGPAVQAMIDADPGGIAPGQARLALGRIAVILACKATLISDITVGDYLNLLDAMRDTRTGGASRVFAYRLLHTLGHLGPGAPPATGRAFLQAAGQRTIEELVDRRPVWGMPVPSGTCSSTTCGNASPRWTTPPSPNWPAIWSGCLFGPISNSTIPGSTRCSCPPPRSHPPGASEDLGGISRAIPGPDGHTAEKLSSGQQARHSVMIKVPRL